MFGCSFLETKPGRAKCQRPLRLGKEIISTHLHPQNHFYKMKLRHGLQLA